jgi:hypothetical protein
MKSTNEDLHERAAALLAESLRLTADGTAIRAALDRVIESDPRRLFARRYPYSHAECRGWLMEAIGDQDGGLTSVLIRLEKERLYPGF